MFGELALHYQHLATATDGAATAYGVDVDAQSASRLEEGSADWEATAFPRRRKDD